MQFKSLDREDLQALRSMVDPERFSTGESVLDLHSGDQSPHPRSRPETVIWPVRRQEVGAILKYAAERRIPVTPWGAGSSLEGNPIPVKGGVVLDFSEMNRILEIRTGDFQVDVEPGVIYQDLNSELRHKGLFFPPDPGARATVGGMIANNASGTRTVRYGSTKNHVLRLAVALANGDILEIGTRASKSSSGYDLVPLFVGSEGTLGVVVQATLRLQGIAAQSSAAIATFPSTEAAAGAVFAIIRSGLDPASIELLGAECTELINLEKKMGLAVSPTLFMEFHGPSRKHLAEILEIVREICHDESCRDFRPGLEKSERDSFFQARHELGEMIIRRHPDCGILSLDVAVPISAYPEMMAAGRSAIARTGLAGYTFSHAGDGNIHLVLAGRKGEKADWDLIEQVSARMVGKALQMGGTATGEHGVGIGKRRFMPEEHGCALGWMKKLKQLFDPAGILNPGKIFPCSLQGGPRSEADTHS